LSSFDTDGKSQFKHEALLYIVHQNKKILGTSSTEFNRIQDPINGVQSTKNYKPFGQA